MAAVAAGSACATAEWERGEGRFGPTGADELGGEFAQAVGDNEVHDEVGIVGQSKVRVGAALREAVAILWKYEARRDARGRERKDKPDEERQGVTERHVRIHPGYGGLREGERGGALLPTVVESTS